MSGMHDHSFGCTCERSYVGRPWRRPTHWTSIDVGRLEAWFGRRSDEAVAKSLGRTVVGIRIKAKRLGLRKKDHAMTARSVAEIFGIDPGTVSKVWIRRGLLRARRGYRQGIHDVWLITEDAVEAFIVLRGQYVDVEKMPPSPYRDLAERHRFYSVPEVCRLTGRHPHALRKALLEGRYLGVKRGTHWYVPAGELPVIARRGHLGRADGMRVMHARRRYEEKLELRRNRRKGVAA